MTLTLRAHDDSAEFSKIFCAELLSQFCVRRISLVLVP